jgi:voltage-gated potassium channel
VKRPVALLAAAAGWTGCCGWLFSVTQHTGIVTGLYWATATATTVGYGDVTPHGAGGQFLAVAVMLTAIPLLGAAFASLAALHLRRHVDKRLDEHHKAIHERLDAIEQKTTP